MVVFTLGGTIASVSDPNAGGGGATPRLSAAELISMLGGAAELPELETVSFRQVPSVDLAPEDIVELHRAIDLRIGAGCDGVVVVQGTDTLEETAFALDLLSSADPPVVVTGAMRTPAAPGADGPANLLAAIRVAAAAEFRRLGCVVVFSDEIHAARYVRKTHTSSLSTFRSQTVGALGWVAEGVPRLALRPAHRRWLPADRLGPVPPVALISLGPGDDARLLDAFSADRVGDLAGVVVEALGGGHAPAAAVARLQAAARRLPVVLASRTGSGETLRHTYGFPGSEIDLLRRGLIAAGTLNGPQARVLLGLTLAAGASRAGIVHAFDVFGVPSAAAPDGVVSLAPDAPPT